ncbi:MAG: hypothetical protein ACYDDF_03025 [Thermoplasmatota archaeon]
MMGRLERIWGTRIVAALSIMAASTHAAVSAEHFSEWWGYGAFFVLASTAQGLLGLVLFALTIEPAEEAPHWWAFRRLTLVAGIIGNLAIVALWTVTRTIGIPFFGPGAGTVEPILAVDLFATGVEVVLVASLLLLLIRSPVPLRAESSPAARSV